MEDRIMYGSIYFASTYDVDRRYRQGNNILYIFDIALWVGQYLDIEYPCGTANYHRYLVPGLVVRLRHHT